jgi:DNA repair protein RecO (recombination protein O)
MQRIRVTLSTRENRDLQTVTEADLLHAYSAIREDLFRSAYSQAMLELTGRLMWQEHSSDDLYDLLLSILQAHQEGVGDPQLLYFAFQIHLAEILGYALHTEECAGCGGSLEAGGKFSFPRGRACCGNCYPQEGATASVGGETVDLISNLGRSEGVAAAAALNPSLTTRRETAAILKRHLEYHTETDLELRALHLAESLDHYGSNSLSSRPLKGAGE